VLPPEPLAPRATPEDSLIDSCSTADNDDTEGDRFLGTLAEAIESMAADDLNAAAMQHDLLNTVDYAKACSVAERDFTTSRKSSGGTLRRGHMDSLYGRRVTNTAHLISTAATTSTLPSSSTAVATAGAVHSPPHIGVYFARPATASRNSEGRDNRTAECSSSTPAASWKRTSLPCHSVADDRKKLAWSERHSVCGGATGATTAALADIDCEQQRKSTGRSTRGSKCRSLEPCSASESGTSLILESSFAGNNDDIPKSSSNNDTLTLHAVESCISLLPSNDRLSQLQSDTDTLTAGSELGLLNTSSTATVAAAASARRSLSLSLSGSGDSSGKLCGGGGSGPHPPQPHGYGLSPSSPNYEDKHRKFSHIGAHALDLFFSPEEAVSPTGQMWCPVATRSHRSPSHDSPPYSSSDHQHPPRLFDPGDRAQRTVTPATNVQVAPFVTSLDVFTDEDDDDDNDDEDVATTSSQFVPQVTSSSVVAEFCCRSSPSVRSHNGRKSSGGGQIGEDPASGGDDLKELVRSKPSDEAWLKLPTCHHKDNHSPSTALVWPADLTYPRSVFCFISFVFCFYLFLFVQKCC